MEIAIPLLAIGSLYIMSNQSKSGNSEPFQSATRFSSDLPNVDVPNVNYPEFYQGVSTEVDMTSKLSTVNKYDTPSTYTDKYFDPSKSFTPKNANSASNQYYSLTGQQVDGDYFKHNNMQPFFGSKSHALNSPNATESTLDNYIGSGSQTIIKKEIAPLFAPGENLQYAFGTPNQTDFIKSRINPSMKMSNVKPFDEIKVGPGIGLGFSAEGVGGYNSGLLGRELWNDKNVDQLRTMNNPKPGGIGLFGHEGPATSYIKNVATADSIGRVEKNRVERAWELGPDRLMTTTGIQKGETLRPMQNEIHSTRMETTHEYGGVASSKNNSQYTTGEYMESTNQSLGAVPFTPAGADGRGSVTDLDYGVKSNQVYPNNRTANIQDTYFGSLGGNLTAVVAPLLDMLRPSRRENTIGTLRPYQNAKGRIESGYVYNPSDKPAATIRETTEVAKRHYQQNANQHGGAYKTTPQQAIRNERDTTTDYYYAGNASSYVQEPRTYDAEYNQRNNDLKSSTVVGYTTRGNMDLLNSNVNMSTNSRRELDTLNGRAVTPSMPAQQGGLGQMNNRREYAERNQNEPDLLNQLKGNPYTLNVLNGL